MQNAFSLDHESISSLDSMIQELSDEERRIHEGAELAAKDFKTAESDLMEALIVVERRKVFRKLGYPSLFRYALESLGLSEAVAYNAITVARKAETVPELRDAIHSGELGLSKAKKVVSVLKDENTPEENAAWVAKAVALPSRKLEKAVADENPQSAIAEREVYRSKKRLELTLGVSEEILLDFRKAQDRVSGSKSRAVTLEETLEEVLRFYLERKDPEERARRIIAKKGFSEKGTPLASAAAEASATTEIPGVAEISITGEKSAASPERFTGTVHVAETAHVAGKVHVNRITPAEDSSSADSSDRKAIPAYRRVPIPAMVLHQVRFRDRGACQAHLPNGKICGTRRWTEIHHRVPVSQGGGNEMENLMTLCRTHHQAFHARESER